MNCVCVCNTSMVSIDRGLTLKQRRTQIKFSKYYDMRDTEAMPVNLWLVNEN